MSSEFLLSIFSLNYFPKIKNSSKGEPARLMPKRDPILVVEELSPHVF